MLSTVWNTQRDSRSYTEKRRGRKETEVTRRRKGESKGERQIQPVISSLSVLHSLEHPKRFSKLDREEKGKGENKGDFGGEKGESKGRQSNQASNYTPK